MNQEIKDAIWDGILVKNQLAEESHQEAKDGNYASAMQKKSEADGARRAIYMILGAMGDIPKEMEKELQSY